VKSLKQWDIHDIPHPVGQTHPGVVFSPNALAGNEAVEEVNVLMGRSVRPSNREPKAYEIYLDRADGLDWKTALKCGMIFIFRKEDVGEKRGRVSEARQRAIKRKVIECFDLRGGL